MRSQLGQQIISSIQFNSILFQKTFRKFTLCYLRYTKEKTKILTQK